MKNIANLFKALSLALFAGIFCVQVNAQQVYGDKYHSSTTVLPGDKMNVDIEAVDYSSQSSSSYRPSYACDGNEETYWRTRGTDSDRYIIFDVGRNNYSSVKCIEIYIRNSNRRGNSITVSSSNNQNYGWSEEGTIDNPGERNYFAIENLSGRYVRVRFTANEQVDINEIYLYSSVIQVENGTVQHKPAKWYNLAVGHNTDMDTFDENGTDKMLPAKENGQDTEIQNAHTLVETIYVNKGESVRLIVPDYLNEAANNQSYQRWYNYATGGTFATGESGNNSIIDLLTPATSGLDGMPTNGEGHRFSNGYVGEPLSSNRLYAMDFYYPADSRESYYVVACDVSGYTDFTETYDRNADHLKSLFASGGYWEPTLSHRFIWYIRAIDSNNRASRDVMDITMPATRIPNLTQEMVALPMDARAYALNGQSPDDVELTVSLLSGSNTAGIVMETTSLTGEDRVIHFDYNGAENGDNTVSVGDNTRATIIVSNGNTEVARFNLTFEEDTRLLSQSQVKELNANEFSGNDESDWRRLAFRTPQKLNDNYEFLTELNFDYDPGVVSDLDYGQSKYYYPFPLAWTSSTYGFYDGSNGDDYMGNHTYPEWGHYSLLNNYIECVGWDNARGIPNPLDCEGEERYNRQGIKSRYHLYADVSDRPGIVARLPFDRTLCSGTELFVTAWVKCARGGTDANNAGMLFTIMGVREENGETTYTPIYRYQTGQIPVTYYNNEAIDLPGFFENSDIPVQREGERNEDFNRRLNTFLQGSRNEWFQVYFSFINSSDKAFDSYALQIDNNSASTNGGDLYLDDVRVYIATVNPTVTQLETKCMDEPVRVNTSFNFERLLSRTGEEATTTATDHYGDIAFCILEKDLYENYLAQHPDDEEGAIKASAMNMGISEVDKENDAKYMVMNYNLNFAQNPLYVAGGDDAKPVVADGKRYFRRNDAPGNRRALTVDIMANVQPNVTYYMVMANPNSINDTNWASFFTGLDDVCTVKSDFTVIPRDIIKINGEIVDPTTDYCAGRTFNFTAEVRIPAPDAGEDGQNEYIPLNEDVYFDWFFGTRAEFIRTNETYRASLNEALTRFREEYKDATVIDENTPATGSFTQGMFDMLVYYTTTAASPAGGQHPHPLVLHQRSLNITLLESGLNLIARPIQVEIENIPGYGDMTGLICWDYIPLTLTVNTSAPQLKPGFNQIAYPDEYANLDPCLRIGLDQIKSVQVGNNGDHELKVDLRDCQFSGVDPTVTKLGLIDDLDKLYLVSTDDPSYSSYFVDAENFDEYSLPAGTIKSLEAHPYEQGASLTNMMTLQFDVTNTQENGFKFTPKEGYTYNFAVHFEEKTARGEASTACSGRLILPIKVVPEYVKWTGDGSSNWNNDTNWKRVSSAEIKRTPVSDDDYMVDGSNANSEGFVPMLFTKVLLPAGSRVNIYKAGYRDGGETSGWETERPAEITQDPTLNIQYDLMAYGNEQVYGHETDALGDITTQRYRVNICDQIHFEPGAEMLRSEYLLYNRAWTDVEIPQGAWTLVSTPLYDVVSGDWYTQSTGVQSTEYFKDIIFNDGGYDRLNPAVYQRSWGDGATIIEENGAHTPVSFHPLWSSVYNDASVAYNYGAGYSVKTAKVAGAGDLLFRFPKNDESYGNSTATFTRDNNGKLAAGQMVVRNTDLGKATDNNKFTLKLTPSDNGYLIVGNPFVSHLNVEEFLNENSNVLQQKYWIADNDGPEAGSADANGSWISTDFGLVAPYKAFYVQRTENAPSGDIEVTFTRDMEEFLPASTDGQDAAQGFVIRANNEKGSSAAALAYSGTADNNYETTEDVQLLTDLLGNESEEPNVYTVAGDIATSINRIKDLRQIPLGIFAADDDVTTLTFTGVAALMEMNTDTPLTEGYTLTVNGASHGRYFIRAKGAGEGTTGITDVETGDGGVNVYSVVQGQVVVSAGAELREVRVYSVGGALLKSECIDGGRTAVTIGGVDSGVAIVRVTTADGVATRKITVK